ncbi:MAG: aspartate ammonia-lyase, partial [Proteobacteria bacterium]|nr:aspartate ammonia-lyase [Pseudomonadota bacterium]
MNNRYRTERDKLGEIKIENGKYWGIHTERAIHNFDISGFKVPLDIVHSLAMVKKACAAANHELGYLGKRKFEAIDRACNEIISGKFDDQFPVDAIQGGAGTSINMNINEVIANRAIEIMGGKKGEYEIVNPLDDINMHQSTNDTYPTAIKIAAIFQLRELSKRVEKLQGAFQKKEKEF